MRAALAFVVLLPAFLAVPADPIPEKGTDGDAGGGADAAVLPCVSGSTLDLVYVDQIAIPLTGASSVALDGMAVFVNPSEDTVQVSLLTADAVGDDSNVATSVQIHQDPIILTLPPGEAKGAAAATAEAVVRAAFDETWVDTEQPALSLGVSLLDGSAFEGTGALDVPFQVHAGDYMFPIVVRLIGDGSKELGAPLSASRVTATCD
jgi:hypothetical protein